MTVTYIHGDKPTEWTKESPEHATLMQLAAMHAVRVFEMDFVCNGNIMCLAHFDYDGWHYLYQDGDSAGNRHLFFYMTSWAADKSPQDMAVDFFNGKLTLVIR